MNTTCPVCTNPAVVKNSASPVCQGCNSNLAYNSLPKSYLVSLIILVAIAVLIPVLLPVSMWLHKWLYPIFGLLFFLDTIFFLKSWNFYKADAA